MRIAGLTQLESPASGCGLFNIWGWRLIIIFFRLKKEKFCKKGLTIGETESSMPRLNSGEWTKCAHFLVIRLSHL